MGNAWEVKEAARAARAAAKGKEDGVEKTLTRQYRLTVAASDLYETQFQLETNDLMRDRSRWTAVHPQAYTSYFTSLAFRLLMRNKAMVRTLLTSMHEKAPWIVFMLLVDENTAVRLTALPLCMRDEFTAAFMLEFPTIAALRSTTAFMVLLAIARYCSIDIVRLEKNNGRLRRKILAASHHVHRQDIYIRHECAVGVGRSSSQGCGNGRLPREGPSR